MDNVKSTLTIEYSIWVGLYDGGADIMHPIDVVESVCQEYVDTVGLCVTISPTKYVYTDGNELGLRIGLINYPRYPSTEKEIKEHALTLAEKLMYRLNQKRVSVMGPEKTFMLSNERISSDG